MSCHFGYERRQSSSSTKLPILVCQRTGQMHWLDTKPVEVELKGLPADFQYAGHEVIVYGEFKD